jgi:ABC-2 type transport system ATP-binding protein
MRVEVRDLVVDRGATRAVDHVSVGAESGRWLGVIGANGSGKTSLLRAVAGRLNLKSGTILVDDQDRTADRAWRAASFGFAPDPAALPATLTGGEFLAILGSQAPGRDPSDLLAPLRRALDFDRFLGRRIGTLSTGMKQRLAIFSAFVGRPGLVILDEPFNWLDPVCAFDTKEALRGLVAGEGLALVTALHEMATLVHYCGSGVLLADGRVSRRLDGADMAAGAKNLAAFEAEMIRGLRAGGAVVSAGASA